MQREAHIPSTYTYSVKTTSAGSSTVFTRTVYRTSPNADKEIKRCIEGSEKRDGIKVVSVELFAGLYNYLTERPRED